MDKNNNGEIPARRGDVDPTRQELNQLLSDVNAPNPDAALPGERLNHAVKEGVDTVNAETVEGVITDTKRETLGEISLGSDAVSDATKGLPKDITAPLVIEADEAAAILSAGLRQEAETLRDHKNNIEDNAQPNNPAVFKENKEGGDSIKFVNDLKTNIPIHTAKEILYDLAARDFITFNDEVKLRRTLDSFENSEQTGPDLFKIINNIKELKKNNNDSPLTVSRKTAGEILDSLVDSQPEVFDGQKIERLQEEIRSFYESKKEKPDEISLKILFKIIEDSINNTADKSPLVAPDLITPKPTSTQGVETDSGDDWHYRKPTPVEPEDEDNETSVNPEPVTPETTPANEPSSEPIIEPTPSTPEPASPSPSPEPVTPETTPANEPSSEPIIEPTPSTPEPTRTETPPQALEIPDPYEFDGIIKTKYRDIKNWFDRNLSVGFGEGKEHRTSNRFFKSIANFWDNKWFNRHDKKSAALEARQDSITNQVNRLKAQISAREARLAGNPSNSERRKLERELRKYEDLLLPLERKQEKLATKLGDFDRVKEKHHERVAARCESISSAIKEKMSENLELINDKKLDLSKREADIQTAKDTLDTCKSALLEIKRQYRSADPLTRPELKANISAIEEKIKEQSDELKEKSKEYRAISKQLNRLAKRTNPWIDLATNYERMADRTAPYSSRDRRPNDTMSETITPTRPSGYEASSESNLEIRDNEPVKIDAYLAIWNAFNTDIPILRESLSLGREKSIPISRLENIIRSNNPSAEGLDRRFQALRKIKTIKDN